MFVKPKFMKCMFINIIENGKILLFIFYIFFYESGKCFLKNRKILFYIFFHENKKYFLKNGKILFFILFYIFFRTESLSFQLYL